MKEHPLRTTTILLVEDDAILAMNLQGMMAQMGYTVAGPLASGEEAIAFVTENSVDLVLMDIELAGTMKGTAAAETIFAFSDVPIVFLTGFSQDPLLEQAKIAAPYGYLIKPVPERELAATLAMALHRHLLDRELKESRIALEKSEAQYRHIFANSSLGIFRTTLAGKVLLVNAEQIKIFGCETAEEVVRDFTDLARQFYVDPHRRQEFISLLQENGVVKHFEYEGRKKNGATAWISMDAKLAPAETVNGQAREPVIDGFVIDITERKRAEMALQESEAHFKSLAESNTDSIMRYDRHCRHLYMNPAALRVSGLQEADVLGKTHRESGFPEALSLFWAEKINQVFATAAPHQGEFEWNSPGGKVSLDWRLTPEVDAKGQVHSVLGVSRDITERKKGDAYREMGREVLQILNEPGEIADSIQYVVDILKTRTRFDAVGLRLQDGEDFPYFAHSGFSQNFLQMENTLISSTAGGAVCRDKDGKVMLAGTCGLVISGEGEIDDPLFTPGGSFWVNDSARLLDSPPRSGHQFCRRNQCIHHNYASFALVPIRHKGKNVGLIHCGDHRKGGFTLPLIEILEGIASHIGAAIMRMHAEEKNRSLQAQLLKAQKMEAIGTLAGGIAHDFNNILGAILGYAEMALDVSPSGSTAAKDMGKVLEAGNRAANLVKQILAFSRQVETERVLLRPGRIAQEVVKLLRPSLPSTITMRQQIETATQSILADPTQVHQIMMNLCTNAFHAMEQTGGTLEMTLKDCELTQDTLQAHPEARPGSYVELTVSDTGAGIEPEMGDKIFDPYFTTKGVGKGTGMGLAIVHGIITSYGGFVTNERNLGNGTIFRVYFPASSQEIVSAFQPVDAALPGQERILLVDDEEMLAELEKRMLERLGYEVTSRTSSLEALATFRRYPNRFDAVITDQTMPGVTGIELARQILQCNPAIPIILCTGYSTLVNEEQIKAEGIRALAMKPLTKTGLATLLRKVLDGKRPQG